MAINKFLAEDYEAVEIGAYEATVDRIESSEEGPYGPQLTWHFKVTDPDYLGKQIKAFSSQAFNPQSKPWAWVEAILRRKVEVGDEIIFTDLIGEKVVLNIGHKETERGTFEKIESLSPVRKGKKKTEAKPPPIELEEEDEEEGPPF